MRAHALLYHDVVAGGDLAASGFPGGDADRYKLDVGDFADHLRAIRATAATPGSAGELLQRRGTSEPLLMLTFDDGGVSGYTHAAALLEEAGWHGHFLVTTGFVGSRSFMSKEQIRSLRRRGHVIGSHSVSHPARISACGHDELVREWRNSRETLADILGEDVTVASVPGGYYSKRVARAAAEAGIRVLFTSEPVTQCRTIDECLIVGRFCLRRGDSPRTAARMAAGDRPQRIRSWLAWNARKLAKTMGGDLYIRARLSALR